MSGAALLPGGHINDATIALRLSQLESVAGKFNPMDFQTHSKRIIMLATPVDIQGDPMRKPSALRKSIRAILPVAGVFILAWLPPAAIAQRVADRQQGNAPSSATASSIMTTEGVRKAIVFTYRDNNLIQQYKYYWWREGCYLTYEPNNAALVPPPACQ
jgi:hypothetical protein